MYVNVHVQQSTVVLYDYGRCRLLVNLFNNRVYGDCNIKRVCLV